MCRLHASIPYRTCKYVLVVELLLFDYFLVCLQELGEEARAAAPPETAGAAGPSSAAEARPAAAAAVAPVRRRHSRGRENDGEATQVILLLLLSSVMCFCNVAERMLRGLQNLTAVQRPSCCKQSMWHESPLWKYQHL